MGDWLPAPLSDEQFYPLVRSLIAQVERDFADVSLAGGIGIHEAWAIDNYANDEERAQARAEDTYTTWQELDLDALDPNSSCLSFFDTIGWTFHLPAYLLRCLHWMAEANLNYGELSVHLDFNTEWRQTPSPFVTPAQRRCCARYLRPVAESDARNEFDLYSAIKVLRENWWDDLDAGERNQIANRWRLG